MRLSMALDGTPDHMRQDFSVAQQVLDLNDIVDVVSQRLIKEFEWNMSRGIVVHDDGITICKDGVWIFLNLKMSMVEVIGECAPRCGG